MVRWKQTVYKLDSFFCFIFYIFIKIYLIKNEEKQELKENWKYFKRYLKGNEYNEDDED